MTVIPPPALDDPRQRALIEVIGDGLPLVPRPYAEIARQLGCSEQAVIARMHALHEQGLIKRLGVVVRHRELGYTANAMVVWDIPDARVREVGSCFGRFAFVTLCYRRPRRLPQWPFNLFTMIHGRDRAAVRERIQELTESCDLAQVPFDVLFSRRRFKQRGACYRSQADAPRRAVS